jgi:hypothetical protein
MLAVLSLAAVMGVGQASAGTAGFEAAHSLKSFEGAYRATPEAFVFGIDLLEIKGVGGYFCKPPGSYYPMSFPRSTLPILWWDGNGSCTGGGSNTSVNFNGCGLWLFAGVNGSKYEGSVITDEGNPSCGPLVFEGIPSNGCKISVDMHQNYGAPVRYYNKQPYPGEPSEGDYVNAYIYFKNLIYSGSGPAGCPQGNGELSWAPGWKLTAYEAPYYWQSALSMYPQL